MNNPNQQINQNPLMTNPIVTESDATVMTTKTIPKTKYKHNFDTIDRGFAIGVFFVGYLYQKIFFTTFFTNLSLIIFVMVLSGVAYSYLWPRKYQQQRNLFHMWCFRYCRHSQS